MSDETQTTDTQTNGSHQDPDKFQEAMQEETRVRELNLARLKALVQEHTPARLAHAFITLRAKKKAIETELEQRLRPIEEQMEIINGELLKRLDEMEAQSIKTPLGTAYVSTTRIGKIVDYDVFNKFVIKNKAVHLLQGRLAITQVADWNESHSTNPVPGIQLSAVRSLRVKGS